MKYIKKFKHWISFFLLFYTLAGFFAIPWFLTNKVPLMLKNRVGIDILINKAFFNPYTFELTLKQKFTSTPKRDANQSKKTKVKPTLNIIALNSHIQNDLALKLKIPKSKLISLANKRANSIKNTLTQKYKLAKERVKILAPKEVDAKRGRWIVCDLKISI